MYRSALCTAFPCRNPVCFSYKHSATPTDHCLEACEARWLVPFAKNKGFVGRGSQLAALETKLFADESCEKIAIMGLGGVGKTQIVLELAYRIRDTRPECSVFWVPAASAEVFEQAYRDIGEALEIPGLTEEGADVKQLVKRGLSQENLGRWVMILDNADDMSLWFDGEGALIHYVPVSQEGSVLFTTRDRKLAVKLAQKNVVEVAEMDPDSAAALFKKSLIHPEVAEDHETTLKVFEQLTFLPLAMVQAAAYINENDISMKEYLSILMDTEDNVIAVLSEGFEDAGIYRRSTNPIATTWFISFEQIRQRDPLAADYLSFMSCLDPRNIPKSLLPVSEPKKRVVDAIGTLTAYSFVTRRQNNQFFDLHRLVHLVTRNWLRQNRSLVTWAEKALSRLVETFPSADHENRSIWNAYLPHTRFLLTSDLVDGTSDKYSLLEKVSLCLLADGMYHETRDIQESILNWRTQRLGQGHVVTLRSLHNLGVTLGKLGLFRSAEAIQRRALTLRQQILGPEHVDTLNSMANLAQTCERQERLKEAEQLAAPVLEKRRRILGREHPDTLRSMANLAGIYSSQGKLEEAEGLGVQVLEIRGRVLGQEHPDTLSGMANLAGIYTNQQKWAEAEHLQAQVTKGRAWVLGPDHPDTLRSMANLARIYYGQQKWTEAERIEEQVVAMREKVLGPDHPDTLNIRSNLAATYSALGKLEEAEEVQKTVVDRRAMLLGQEHPDTMSSMAKLATIHWDQVKLKEIERLETDLAGLRAKVFGPEHPSTLRSMANLGLAYRELGRYDEAAQILAKVLETRSRVLPADHPCRINTMQSLARTRKKQGRDEDAAALLAEVVQLLERRAGKDAPETRSFAALLESWGQPGNHE